MMWQTALLPFFVLLIAGALLSWAVTTLLRQAQWVDHTTAVIAHANEGLRLAVDMETGLRGYQLTGDPTLLAPYQQASKLLPAQFDRISRMVSDNSRQTQQAIAMRRAWESWFGYARDVIARKQAGQNVQGRELNLQGKNLFDNLRAEFQKLVTTEERLKAGRSASVQELNRSLLRYRFTGILLLGVGLGWFAVHQLRTSNRIFQETESAIRKQAELLHVTLSSIKDAVVATDKEGNITFLNPEAELLTGWMTAEAQNKPLKNVFPIRNQTTREPMEDPVAQVLRTGQLVNVMNHTLLLAKDGREVAISESGAPIRDNKGNLLGVVLVFRDVSREYAAREALRQSEQRYRTLFELSPSNILLIDSETGHFLDFNQRTHEFYGYTREEFSRLRIADVEPQVSPEEILTRIAQIRQAGEARFEVVHCTRSGEPRNILVATRLLNFDSKPIFLSVWQDVTDIRKAETALRQNEQQLQAIFTQAAVGMVQMDAHTRNFVRANPCFCSMTGYSETELARMTPADLTHPDDRLEDEHRLTTLWSPLQTYEAEKRYVRKDGQTIWVSVTATMLTDEKDHPLRTIAVVNDITKSRQAVEALRVEEMRLRLAVEATELGTWDWDIAEDNLVWSHRCKQLFNIAPEKPLAYQDFLNAIHPDDRARADQAVQQSLHPNGTGKYNIDLRVPRNDGNVRWVNCRGQVFFEGDGDFRKAVRFSGTALDISDRKRAEQSLLEAREELERQVDARTHDLSVALTKAQEVDRLKSEFLASMSHELRTPLNSIIGFSEIVLAEIPGPLNEEQKRQLTMAHSSARHLLHLINDLLDLARIESGRVEPSFEDIDPAEVVNEAMEVIRPLAERKGLLLDQFLDLPPVLHTDRKMFFQVLLNLLNNAVKFTEMGQVRMETKTMEDHLIVNVRDTGIGIKPDQKPMLFEAFRQIDGSARKRYEGTGLGLYLCRNILSLLGGRIWVESEFGKGSVFSFVLPLNFPENSARLRNDRGENLVNRG
jgi:PAS domain S-box-containing protein